MFKGYLSLGGNEIANTARVYAYVYNSNAGIPLRDCEDCDGILAALGHEPYTSPLVDDAPWFDANRPETQRFYGFYPTEIQGIEDSTREADVLENIGDGGWVGAVRKGSRSIRVKGVLLAADDMAMSAGMTWLRSALDPAECVSHGGSCGGAQLCYWTSCPEICELYDRTFEAGDSMPIQNASPANSPMIFRFQGFRDSIWRGTFDWSTSQEGVIVKWGAVYADDIDTHLPDEDHGPVVLRRVNYVPNPTFVSNNSLWTSVVSPGGWSYGADPAAPDCDPKNWISMWSTEDGVVGPGWTYAWTGAADASTSTATVDGNIAYTNLVPNPRFRALTGVVPTGWVASPGATIDDDGEGGGYMGIRPDGSTNDTYATFGSEVGFQLGMVPGGTYTFIVEGFSNAFTSTNLSPYARRVAVVIDGEVVAVSEEITETDDDVRRYTFTIPAEATQASLRLYSGSDVPTDAMVYYSFDLIEATSFGVQPYLGYRFDGESVVMQQGIWRTTTMSTPTTSPMTAAFKARRTAPGDALVEVRVVRAADAVVLSTGTFQVESTDWTQFSFQTPIGGKVYLEVRFYGTVELAEFDFELGITPLPYLDGNQTEACAMAGYLTGEVPPEMAPTEYTIGWLGTPNLSASFAQWNGVMTIGAPMFYWGDRNHLDNAGICKAYPTLDVLQGTLTGYFIAGYRLPISPARQLERYERTMHDVTCVEGPSIIRERTFTSGARMREVDFILVAGNPYAYGVEQILMINQRMDLLDTNPWSDFDCAVDEPSAIVDPDCPPVPSPPRPPAIQNSCVTPENTWQRYWLTIPEEFVSQWSASSPKIEVTSGSQAIRQMRVQVYPNPFKRTPYSGFTRQNRVTNPKAATNTSGYAASVGGGTSTLTRITGQPDPGGVGTNAIRSTATVAVTGAWRLTYNVDIADAENRDWRAMAYFKSSFALQARMRISFRNAANAEIDYSEGPIVAGTTSWQKLIRAGRAPVGTKKILIQIGSSSGGGALNSTFDVTGVVLEEMPTPDKVTGVPVFQTDFDSGMPPYNTGLYPSNGVIDDSPMRNFPDGSYPQKALRFDATANLPGTYPGLRGVPVVTKPGKWYVTTARFYVEPGAVFTHLYVFGDGDAGGTGTVTSANAQIAWPEPPLTAPFQRASDGGSPAAIEAGVGGSFTKGTIWLIDMTVLEIDYPDTYFDGDTDPANGYFYAWLGTAGASESIGLRPGVDPCSFCSEFVVSYLPAQTVLTVDAIMQNAYAEQRGGDPVSVNHLMYASDGSPMQWPELSCGQEYLLAIDVPKPLLSDVKVSVTVATRE